MIVIGRVTFDKKRRSTVLGLESVKWHSSQFIAENVKTVKMQSYFFCHTSYFANNSHTISFHYEKFPSSLLSHPQFSPLKRLNRSKDLRKRKIKISQKEFFLFLSSYSLCALWKSNEIYCIRSSEGKSEFINCKASWNSVPSILSRAFFSSIFTKLRTIKGVP